MTTTTRKGKRPQRVRITIGDVNAIARLIVTRRLSESEACVHLGINPPSWFNWKSKGRNMVKNAECLTRVRAAHIDALISSIDEMGSPAAGSKRDWRAKAWQAERLFNDRFGAQQQPTADTPPALNIGNVNLWLSAAYRPPAQVVDVEPAKQLEDPPPPKKMPSLLPPPPGT